MGLEDQREDGQRPLPSRHGQGRGGVPGGGQASRYSARGWGARHEGSGADAVKATVTVMLKAGVLDPQGKAIGHALNTLGFDNVGEVRAGKVIELELTEVDPERARAAAEQMATKLLANPVIESFRVSLDVA